MRTANQNAVEARPRASPLCASRRDTTGRAGPFVRGKPRQHLTVRPSPSGGRTSTRLVPRGGRGPHTEGTTDEESPGSRWSLDGSQVGAGGNDEVSGMTYERRMTVDSRPPTEIGTLIENHVKGFNTGANDLFRSVFGETAIIIDGIAPYRWLNPNARPSG